MRSFLNAPNNRQTYHRCCRQCCHCILHRRCRCLNLSPVQAPLLVALPLLCTVVSLLCLLILAIPLYLSTNNISWINYYYLENVNTMDALIVSMQMVLVGFVLHTVDGVYVAMHLAQTLLKLEDGASNMATRSQLCGMDGCSNQSIVRGLCKRHIAHHCCNVIKCTKSVFSHNMCRFHYSLANESCTVTNESITVSTTTNFITESSTVTTNSFTVTNESSTVMEIDIVIQQVMEFVGMRNWEQVHTFAAVCEF